MIYILAYKIALFVHLQSPNKQRLWENKFINSRISQQTFSVICNDTEIKNQSVLCI